MLSGFALGLFEGLVLKFLGELITKLLGGFIPIILRGSTLRLLAGLTEFVWGALVKAPLIRAVFSAVATLSRRVWMFTSRAQLFVARLNYRASITSFLVLCPNAPSMILLRSIALTYSDAAITYNARTSEPPYIPVGTSMIFLSSWLSTLRPQKFVRAPSSYAVAL
jgi:hypothetical protein